MQATDNCHILPDVVRACVCSWDRCASIAQEDPGRVFLHPGSVYSNEKEHVHLYLVYFEKALTSQLYIRDATFANPYSILVRPRAPMWTSRFTSLSCAESLSCAGMGGCSYLVETSPCSTSKEQLQSTIGLSTVRRRELLCLQNQFVQSWITCCRGRSRDPRPTLRTQPSSEQSFNC